MLANDKQVFNYRVVIGEYIRIFWSLCHY